MSVVNRIQVELDGIGDEDVGKWAVRINKALGIRMNRNQLIIARLKQPVTLEDENFVYYALKSAAAASGIRIIRTDYQSSGEFTNQAGRWFVKRYRVIWNRQLELV